MFVDDWKKARVIPIYKSEDRKRCENYRPITILPILSKLFEKEVFGQLYQNLISNSVSFFTFSIGFSTQTLDIVLTTMNGR